MVPTADAGHHEDLMEEDKENVQLTNDVADLRRQLSVLLRSLLPLSFTMRHLLSIHIITMRLRRILRWLRTSKHGMTLPKPIHKLQTYIHQRCSRLRVQSVKL